MKILIADDERWIRKDIRKMIDTEGLEGVKAENGWSADNNYGL